MSSGDRPDRHTRHVNELTLVPAGGGAIVGDSPDRRVEILSDHETLNVTWSRFGPHRDGADLHIHRRHTDLFYVLEGEFTLRLGIGDEPVLLPAGTLGRIPPLVVHGFRNGSDAETRFLNLHAPGRRFSEYMRARRDGRAFSYDQFDPPADGWRSPADAVIGGETVVTDEPGLRVALLADVDEIAVAETWSEPGALSASPYLHRRHVESFYVLEGELTFTAGGRELRAGAGAWVQVPPGVAHAVAVSGDRPARFLDLHTPSFGLGALDQVPA